LNPRPGWLALSIVLLWLGWFGFNSGSTLALNLEAQIVVLTTFLAASSAFLSTMFFRYLMTKENPDLVYAVNGILMGLIVITPLAGFVSPASAVVLGLIAGPLFLLSEKLFSKFRWFSDPVGLFSGHMIGGLFGLSMIAFFTQQPFAADAGSPSLPNGLLFGGGYPALQQLETELLGTATVMVTIFALSFATMWAVGLILHGTTTDYKKEGLTEENQSKST
jgi:Amt family ammonium transporter